MIRWTWAFLLLVACEKQYERTSAGCKCADTLGAGKCKCNHCGGDKGALCYCGTGTCECGAAKDKCKCEHCLGETDGPRCDCKKK